jgi:hypothetical protein
LKIWSCGTLEEEEEEEREKTHKMRERRGFA